MKTTRSTKPEYRLWLEILDREPELKSLSPTQALEELKMGGFPPQLIRAYLDQRQVQ